jgi:opacity protein-like surface antigen
MGNVGWAEGLMLFMVAVAVAVAVATAAAAADWMRPIRCMTGRSESTDTATCSRGKTTLRRIVRGEMVPLGRAHPQLTLQ